MVSITLVRKGASMFVSIETTFFKKKWRNLLRLFI